MNKILTNDELYYLNQIIAEMYAESIPETAFQTFLEGLKSLVSYEKGDIYFYHKDKSDLIIENFISIDWGNDDLVLYLDNYYTMDDVLPIVAGENSMMFRCSDIFDMNERRKTKYYHELLAPAEMEYSIEGNLILSPDGTIGGIGIHRSSRQKDFSERDLSILKLCRIHLSNVAAKYRGSCSKESTFLWLFPAIMHMKNVGILVLDFDFSVCESNLPTVEFVSRDHLDELMQKIVSICRQIRAKLLRQRDEGIFAELRTRGRIEIGGKSYYTNITCVPVPENSNSVRYAVMIFDYAGIFSDILKELRTTYKLSEREFEVLQAMMRGMNNQEIANELFVTLPTVKKHLSNIYQKLEIEGKRQILSTIL
jgi:DNA-binding CsgD family transcriptional regulator